MRPGPTGARPGRLLGVCWRLLPLPGPLGAEVGRVTVVAQVNSSAGCAMNDRESPGVTLLTGTAQVLGAPAVTAASCSGADRAQRAPRGELPGRPRPDVAGIVDMVALEQRRDAAALRPHRLIVWHRPPGSPPPPRRVRQSLDCVQCRDRARLSASGAN